MKSEDKLQAWINIDHISAEKSFGVLLLGLRRMYVWKDTAGKVRVGLSRRQAALLIQEQFGRKYSEDDLRGAENGTSIRQKERAMLLQFYSAMLVKLQ